MLEYKESPLKSKTEAYAGRITLLYDYLITNKHEHVMATQIYRSGTSIGANVMESRFAQSGADFINKLNKVVIKTINYSLYTINYKR